MITRSEMGVLLYNYGMFLVGGVKLPNDALVLRLAIRIRAGTREHNTCRCHIFTLCCTFLTSKSGFIGS